MDIAYTSLAGTKPVNEDFAGAMLPEEGQEAMGVIAAIADGVSAGGLGRDAVGNGRDHAHGPVSYTHLTLPTKA